MNQPSARRPDHPIPPARPARRLLASALLAAFGQAYGPAWAQLPVGPAVVNGSAGIVTAGAQMTITNAPNTVINWQSFSISPDNAVRFQQAGADSKVLNRVLGNDPSSILGSLSSNGQVWLVNPNGVLFGAGARIDVGALVASTLGVSDADFVAGRLAFGANGVPGGQVLNQASITTAYGGRVWLIGGSVRNEGTVNTQSGEIILAAGQSIDLVDSGLPNVTVRVSASGNDVVNVGTLLAPFGGSIDLHGAMVNQQGFVAANTLDASKPGHIVIRATGDVQLGQGSTTFVDADPGAHAPGGSLTVESAGGTTTVLGAVSALGVDSVGGHISLLGNKVVVDSIQGVDASGSRGGGTVLIGTAQPLVSTAVPLTPNVAIKAGTLIRANALDVGTGGSLVIRSDGMTTILGALQATGGPQGGNGGAVETTGSVVDARPSAIGVRAGPGGSAGSWVLKANNVSIYDPACLSCAQTPGSELLESMVTTALVGGVLQQGGQVRLEASGAIPAPQGGSLTVLAGIDATGAPAGAALTLGAQNSLSLYPGVHIGGASNALPVTLTAGLGQSGAGTISLGAGAGIDTAGGNLRLGGGSNGTDPANRVSLAGAALDAGEGTLGVTASTVDIRANSSLSAGAIVLSGKALAIADSALTAHGSPDAIVTTHASTGPGTIAIAGDTVSATRTQLTAVGVLGITGATAISLDTAALAAGDSGDAIVLSTARLSATTSKLTTPNGRWLTYLDTLDAFSAPLFENLGYKFLQVGAGSTAAPAVSGSGNNGVIVREAVDARIAVNAGRVYNGTTQASFTTALASNLPPAFTLLGQEDAFHGQFGDKNAGTGKAITLDGGSAPFSIVTSTGEAVYGVRQTYVADITPKPVTVSLTAASKVYDASRTATVSGTVAGAVAGDDVRVGTLTGQFDTKDAGSGKAVTVSGGTLGGADAGNYSLAVTSAAVADITPRPITTAGLSVQDKVYDGTRAATVTGGLAGVLAGDAVSLGGGALFSDKNVGANKTVSVAGALLSGPDARDYVLGDATSFLAAIKPLAVTVTGLSALDKVYDGTRTAGVSAALAGTVPGDAVTLNLVGQFDNKNVGAGKAVAVTGALGGADAANYTLSLPASASAAITYRPLQIVLTGDVRKEYDATGQASVAADAFRLDGLVAGETLSIRGPTQASYLTPDVGSNKAVTASGSFEVGGADAANYRIGTTGLSATPSIVQATASGNVGTITPATLVYEALPTTGIGSLGVGTLAGRVSGFKGGDTLANATTGTLAWESTVTPASGPGTYAVYGAGLLATNYRFVQAPGNVNALEVKPGLLPGGSQQQALDSSDQAIQAAVHATAPTVDVAALGATLFDRSSAASSKTFEVVPIGSMSQDELDRMLAYRRDFKRQLFADAIYKLAIDPSLADVRPCATEADAASGTCRITDEQVSAAQARAARTAAAAITLSAPAGRARIASLPQIERKIALMIGISDYADKNIPQLDNAVPDADAVGQVFADKLGYEVRVVRNPDKASIIAALNKLAADAGSADSVVVYYAGHGYSLEKNGAGYWIAADSTVTDPKGWISNADIASLLSRIRSRQVTLISDSCYSGAFAREGLGAVGKNVSVDEVLAKRSVVVLSSGGDEPVADEGKEGHSIFAWYLMRTIGSVKAWAPGSLVFSEVQAGVSKEFPQTPKYGSLTAAGHQAGGDYLFESRSH